MPAISACHRAGLAAGLTYKSRAPDKITHTGVVLVALAGVAALAAAAQPVAPAGVGVAQVDFRLAVVAGEARGAAAPQPVDGVDGAEQDRVGADERRRAVELQHGDALHVVLAGLAQADVVVEGQHPLRGNQGQQRPVEVDLLLQVLRGEELVSNATREQGWEGDVQDIGADVRVVLDVENKDAVLGGGEHGCHPLHKEGQEGRKEPLLGHVLQPHCDAVGEHVVRDDGDTQGADCSDTVNTIWREGRK